MPIQLIHSYYVVIDRGPRVEDYLEDWLGTLVASKSTLVNAERQLRPAVAAAGVFCLVVDATLLLLSVHSMPLPVWVFVVLVTCLPLASNVLQFAKNGSTSVGMIPLMVLSMVPATIAGTRALPKFGIAWWVCAALCALSLAFCAEFAWWFRRLRHAWEHQPAVDDNAVIIVLGGAIRDGEPVETVQNRLHVAADLLRASPSRICILTGGICEDGTTTEAEAMRDWLVKHENIAPSWLILETRALNTEQNFTYSHKLIEEHAWENRQVCIVSSSYHLYRALAIARETFENITCVPAPVPYGSLPQQWCREVLIILFKGEVAA